MQKIILPDKVRFIINELEKHGYEAYAVGGCIRDSLLGRIPEDWDVTTSATPQQVKNIFAHTIDTGIMHGTVTVMLEKEGFEVTTYRIDGKYKDSRHPEQVSFTPSLAEDLRRRDFTINALAYNGRNKTSSTVEKADTLEKIADSKADISEGIVDLFGGIEDMQNSQVRCVGSPNERFEEDALRLMRAVRFSAQLDFSIEEKTLRAIALHAQELRKISAERIRTELTKLLLSAYPDRLLTAYETGLTNVILPEFDRMMTTPQKNPHHIYNVGMHTIHALLFLAAESVPGGKLEAIDKKSQIQLRYAALLHDVGKPDTLTLDAKGTAHFYGHAHAGAQIAKAVLLRLKFDNETIQAVEHLIELHDYRYSNGKSPTTASTMRRAICRIGPKLLPLHFLLQEADLRAQNPALLEDKLRQLQEAKQLAAEILADKQCICLKDLAINGSDLIQAGWTQGREIGLILSRLLEYVLEHPEANNKEALLTRAKLETPPQN